MSEVKEVKTESSRLLDPKNESSTKRIADAAEAWKDIELCVGPSFHLQWQERLLPVLAMDEANHKRSLEAITDQSEKTEADVTFHEQRFGEKYRTIVIDIDFSDGSDFGSIRTCAETMRTWRQPLGMVDSDLNDLVGGDSKSEKRESKGDGSGSGSGVSLEVNMMNVIRLITQMHLEKVTTPIVLCASTRPKRITPTTPTSTPKIPPTGTTVGAVSSSSPSTSSSSSSSSIDWADSNGPVPYRPIIRMNCRNHKSTGFKHSPDSLQTFVIPVNIFLTGLPSSSPYNVTTNMLSPVADTSFASSVGADPTAGMSDLRAVGWPSEYKNWVVQELKDSAACCCVIL